MAARSFDGVNDNLLSADNAVAGLNVTQKSWSYWAYVTVQPVGDQAAVTLATANGAGNARAGLYVVAPTTAGFRGQLTVSAATSNGRWATPDITLNARHHIAVTHDRSSVTNDPVMYVDGVSVSVTEITTPAPSILTGEDTLKLGENAGGAEDFAGSAAHLAIQGSILWSAAEVNRAMWWGRPHGGLHVYHPFLTSKLADEGSAAETLTATGTTMGTVVTPCVRPGSAMLGMGVGW